MSTETTHTDLEEIEITKPEKLLTVVLALFLLIGGLWAYSKIDEISQSSYRSPTTYLTVAEQAAVARANAAQGRLSAAQTAVQRTRQDLGLAREAYRTALDAGSPAP